MIISYINEIYNWLFMSPSLSFLLTVSATVIDTSYDIESMLAIHWSRGELQLLAVRLHVHSNTHNWHSTLTSLMWNTPYLFKRFHSTLQMIKFMHMLLAVLLASMSANEMEKDSRLLGDMMDAQNAKSYSSRRAFYRSQTGNVGAGADFYNPEDFFRRSGWSRSMYYY